MNNTAALPAESTDVDSLTIRPALPGDFGAIVEIYDYEVLNEISTMDNQVRSPEAWQEWFAAHQNDRYPLLVALGSTHEVIGWGSLSPWSPRGGFARAVEPSVFVRREHRGRGIGRRLLGDLVDCARAANHRVVVGRMHAHNARCRRISFANGFSLVGVVHAAGEKFGRVYDAVIVELVL